MQGSKFPWAVELSEKISELERKYSVQCMLVYNKYFSLHFGRDPALSLYIYPTEGMKEGSQEFSEAVDAIHDEINEKSMVGGVMCLRHIQAFIIGSSDYTRWFERFRDDPGRLPLADMAHGADLIGEVLYGRKFMDEIHRQAKAFFGNYIIYFWYQDTPRRYREKQKKIEAQQEKYRSYVKERKKVFNAYELDELKGLLIYLEKRCISKYACVVALDGSGRPIGRAISWWFNGSLRVYYIDPHHLKEVDFDESHQVKKAIDIFALEFPELFERLQKRPASVLFVDDQSGYGNTGLALMRFIRSFTYYPRVKLHLICMSSYMVDNVPSWLRNRPLQGIRLVNKRFTFKSLNYSTDLSRDFYAKLYKHVMEWKK
jgi:hypothetical protein